MPRFLLLQNGDNKCLYLMWLLQELNDQHNQSFKNTQNSKHRLSLLLHVNFFTNADLKKKKKLSIASCIPRTRQAFLSSAPSSPSLYGRPFPQAIYLTKINSSLKTPQVLSLSRSFPCLPYKESLLWASLVAQTIKNLPAIQETWVWSLGQEDPLVKEMATHSSILA